MYENSVKTIYENEDILVEEVDHSKCYCEWTYIVTNKTNGTIHFKNDECSHWWDLEPNDYINLLSYDKELIEFLFIDDNIDYEVIYEVMPEGWKKYYRPTVPSGYKAICNGESYFNGHRQRGIMKL